MLFRERKRWIIGLPWTFTVYSSDGKVLYIDTGFLNKKQEEIRLYRILDIGYSANLIQRIFGIGTISLRTSDKSAGSIDLINVKDAMTVKKLLSDYVEKERKAQRIPLEGEVQSPIDVAPGCRFASRCRYATEACRHQTPVLEERSPGHFVACLKK